MAIWISCIVLLLAGAYGGRVLVRRRRVVAWSRAQRALQAARLAAPPFVDALGTFACDGNAWGAAAVGARGPVRLTIYNADPEDVPRVVERHRAFLVAALADDASLRLAAALPLVSPYNRSWRDGREEMDAEQLSNELSLHSVRLPLDEHEGPFLIFRAAASLLGGHGVELALDATYAPRTRG